MFAGYRGYDALGLPIAYPFGHGLSYNSFSYSEELLAIIGNMPLATLAAFPGLGVTGEMIGAMAPP